MQEMTPNQPNHHVYERGNTQKDESSWPVRARGKNHSNCFFFDESLKQIFFRHFCGYFYWDLNSHHFHSDKWINSSTLRSRSSYFIPIVRSYIKHFWIRGIYTYIIIIFCRLIPLLKVGPELITGWWFQRVQFDFRIRFKWVGIGSATN